MVLYVTEKGLVHTSNYATLKRLLCVLFKDDNTMLKESLMIEDTLNGVSCIRGWHP